MNPLKTNQINLYKSIIIILIIILVIFIGYLILEVPKTKLELQAYNLGKLEGGIEWNNRVSNSIINNGTIPILVSDGSIQYIKINQEFCREYGI